MNLEEQKKNDGRELRRESHTTFCSWQARMAAARKMNGNMCLVHISGCDKYRFVERRSRLYLHSVSVWIADNPPDHPRCKTKIPIMTHQFEREKKGRRDKLTSMTR